MSTTSTPARGALRVATAGGVYEIRVTGEGLAGLAEVMEPWAGVPSALVTDANVDALYGDETVAALDRAGVPHARMVLPAGEATKSFGQLRTLLERLLAAGVPRSGVVVALGGGVIGDLAGLAASLLRRGVACVQVPTTLIGQVDSAIGGKTAVNSDRGKNLVGTFHQPAAVYASTRCLATLPVAELRAGMAEVVKYGLLAGDPLLASIEGAVDAALAADTDALTPLVRRCAAYKADVVVRDEREAGPRRLLNLGHTVGHAVERALGYERVRHGEAVAIGMVAACALSEARELTDGAVGARLVRLLARLGLPAEAHGLDRDAVRGALAQDKKATGDALHWVLLRGPGDPVVEAMPLEQLDRWLDRLASRSVLGWATA